VPVCPTCGKENPEGFQFCGFCTAPLTVLLPREQRKTVTVLFCDVTGSTALGESTDPEALRALLARYFERMKGIVESHGGTVEKFIGDAVMAVFGVPQVHEDDALRACRAAVEMRDALPELGVRARIGVNTGEVVTGTEERLATGDAVNVAARLEHAARPGEILIGTDTVRLLRCAVETEPIEPLELKGKSEAVSAYRLLAVHAAPERRHETRFVGREAELEFLREAWERVVTGGRCELVTVLGDAGVGKSRLTLQFLASAQARAVRGRCLPYGEGITYWPVIEVLKQLDALPSDAAAAASLRSLLGRTDRGTSPDEIAWAFRKLLEEQAPIVCIFDDIQWGEETFLDLIEHVALLSGAPSFLLCLARPDFADRRPQWPVTIRLEPLRDPDVDELIPGSLPGDLRARIARAAGGNPLFLTEMAAMADETGADVLVPPDLQALLAARLDQLETEERSVLERGAVEGEIFHRGSVQALSVDGTVVSRLAALVRKELIRPDQTQLPGDDAFRFRHLLIRDAAYEALPKATRAELHARFADWLEERGADLVELDEILGYHLEQAARYKHELGQPDLGLATRAGKCLAAAGRRALWRVDYRAARTLLGRALDLTRPIRLDVHLEVDLSRTFRDDPKEAAAIAEAAAERARALADERGEALGCVATAMYRLAFDPDVDGLATGARRAVRILEEVEDHAGLVTVWNALASVANFRGRLDDCAHAAEQCIRHLRAAGQRSAQLFGLGPSLFHGPRPADEALRTLDEALPESPHPLGLLYRSGLLGMLGCLDEAWALAAPAAEQLPELGDMSAPEWLAEIAELAGDYEAAARYGKETCEIYEARGQTTFLSTYGPKLGRSLCTLGRFHEAEPLARLGRELGHEQDLVTQTLWRQVQARVYAHRGEHSEAERHAREAAEIAERTDGLNLQGGALCDLAEVLAAADRDDEAVRAFEQALERYERKKNLAMLAQVRPKLEELRAHGQ
jgi:class 3 adenylate cyclase